MKTAVEKVGNDVEKQVWRRPSFDVNQTNDSYEVKVAIPGVPADGVDISLDKSTLNVVARRSDAVPKSWKTIRKERQEGDYRLNLELNVHVDEGSIKASVADGILKLCLPKSAEAKPRKIKVN